MVQASFSAVFLLKVALLFPQELPPPMISKEVSELAEILSECAAGRYALTLRLMLRSFRRKMGEATMAPGSPGGGINLLNGAMTPIGMPNLMSMQGGAGSHMVSDFSFMDDLGPFNWPENGFSPSSLPAWITETVSSLATGTSRGIWLELIIVDSFLRIYRTLRILVCPLRDLTRFSYHQSKPDMYCNVFIR